MHYSPYFLLLIITWVYFSQPQLPKLVPQKVAKPECPLLWVTLNVQLRHICQPQTWSHQDSQDLGILDRHLPFGAAPPGFHKWSCGMKKQSVQYTSHFSIHSMQAMAICSRNGSSCLNCRISRVLESWPFWCALLMHLCMVALLLFNKDEVCWHILTSLTYLPLHRRCVECSSFIIFP